VHNVVQKLPDVSLVPMIADVIMQQTCEE